MAHPNGSSEAQWYAEVRSQASHDGADVESVRSGYRDDDAKGDAEVLEWSATLSDTNATGNFGEADEAGPALLQDRARALRTSMFSRGLLDLVWKDARRPSLPLPWEHPALAQVFDRNFGRADIIPRLTHVGRAEFISDAASSSQTAAAETGIAWTREQPFKARRLSV